LGGNSAANGINNAGQVVGYSFTADVLSHFFAVIWNGTTPATVLAAPLGALDYSASSINNGGQSVGTYTYAIEPSTPVTHGVIWIAGTPISLGTLGGLNSSANAINESGQVVGQADLGSHDIFHAVMWTIKSNIPTPTDLGTLTGKSFSSAFGIKIGARW